ncbi:MAG: hypothetical protein ABSG67_08445 [Thermoguttaceae bacterium]|jgi:hypothetical protein
MSVESRLQKLEQVLAARRPPRIIEIQFVIVSSRAEVAALAALREREERPPEFNNNSGRVRFNFLPNIYAKTYLEQHCIVLPATESQTQEA